MLFDIDMSATSEMHPAQPGTNGIWTFVLLDMGVFALMFLVYLSERYRVPEVFTLAQRHLDPRVGLASTLLLLTSSWGMAEAVGAIRASDRRRGKRFLTLALTTGLLFVVNKGFEYSGKFAIGITPATDAFFALYFVITGLHLLHVLGGLTFMASLRARVGEGVGNPAYLKNAENVGLFWHFVDVLWLFIFPLLYLVQ